MSCISSDEIVKNGTLAQVVEQWTENPCVLGSTPRGTTSEDLLNDSGSSFLSAALCIIPQT